MKKILIVNIGAGIGGIETMMKNIVLRLDCQKYHVDIMTFCDKCAFQNIFEKEGCTVFHITRRSQNPIKHNNEILQFFKLHKYDYVWNNTSAACICVINKAAKESGAIVITHCHGSMVGKSVKFGTIKYIINNIQHLLNKKRMIKHTDCQFACSDLAANHLFGVNNRAIIIRNGIDTDEFKYSSAVAGKIKQEFNLAQKKIIGIVGRLSSQKNVEKAINIFYQIYKEDSNYVLLIVGDGELKEKLTEQVNILNIKENVVFCGFRDDISNILSAIDVLIMPSIFEGLPVVGVEAQCSGAKCFFSDTISKDILITPNAKMIPLAASDKIWAQEILDCELTNDRTEYAKLVVLAGYDIKQTVKQIEEIIV